MSGGTKFAIEIRERYHDVVGDRWPAAVDPEADELLSSWLHRLGHANGLAPRAFARVLGLSGGMDSPRLDLRLPADLSVWLSVRTGVAPTAMTAMTMTEGAPAPLWLPLRETAERSCSTWIQYCALCLADDRAPYFRRSWRFASRISCFTHGCGLRDRCPACRGGIASFAQTELVPHYVCARCGFDLRGAARISVALGARRLERSVDDICRADLVKGSLAIDEWVACLVRIPDGVGLGSGRPLADLPAPARIRCFERLARKADDSGVVALDRAVSGRCRMARAAGGCEGLIARFVDVVEECQGSAKFAPTPPQGVDLAALLAAYARVLGTRARRCEPRAPAPATSLAA